MPTHRMETTFGFRWRLAAAVAAVLLVAACGSSSPKGAGAAAPVGTTKTTGWPGNAAWQQVVKQAKAEGSVTVYTATVPAVAARLQTAFEKAYPGITVNIYRDVSGTLLTKIGAQKAAGSGGADVLIDTDFGWFHDHTGDLIAPSGPSAAAWPSADLLDGKTIYGQVEPITILYNTNLVKTPPTTYEDLLQPQYKGAMGTIDISSATTVVAWYDWLTQTVGTDYWQKLDAQSLKFYEGSPQLSQAVASGEIKVSDFGNPSVVDPLKQQGAPISEIIPKPSLGYGYGVAALNFAKHQAAARVFVNWIQSVTGQTAWVGPGGTASPLGSKIPNSVPIKSITTYDPAKYTPAAVNQITAHWNSVFHA